FDPQPGRDGIILDCDSEASLVVRVYAFDPLGRGDYCSVIVLVQGADNVCAGANRGSIAGTIMSQNGSPIDQVTVDLSGPNSDNSQLSTDDGEFFFPDLKQGDDYTIDALRTDYINHSQGVSTFDLVLITQHILGLREIVSPYDRMAADANGDKDISVQDIIAIRRLILGLDDEYQNNSAYRFVDASFIFPVPSNPWATTFPEVVNVNNLAGNVTEADFIGIMVGDVDGNGVDNLVSGNGTNGRPRAGAKHFHTEDQLLSAGNTYLVELSAAEAAGLVGLQGTFQFSSAVALTQVEEANTQFGVAHLNLGLLSRGLLPFSFNTANGLSTEAPVLRLEVVALEDARLSDVLSINDKQVFAEGYTPGGTTVNLGITFGESSALTLVPRGDVLGQNVPNPVTETTVIPFQLENAEAVTLVVRDLTGRVLVQRNMDGSKGGNRFVLARAALGSAGVLTYTLSAGEFSATRKMIVK
ncbi:MAG: T9SS type A sorting domain-containing protein, partial [Bacteroidota bacterium]